jgi:hypothetical protein
MQTTVPSTSVYSSQINSQQTSSVKSYPAPIKSRKSNAPIEIPVIPLFEHGHGHGSFGCMSEAPPSYLSEEEAVELIREYAKEEGVEFSLSEGFSLNMYVPQLNLGYQLYSETPDSTNVLVPGYTQTDYKLDGYNKNLKIAFEFISESDYKNLALKSPNGLPYMSGGYYYREAAQAVNDQLNKYRDQVITATFYDPVFNIEDYWSNEEHMYDYDDQTVAAVAKRDLKAQVKDFIQWLKTQNII